MKLPKLKLTPQQSFDLQMWAIVALIFLICFVLWVGTAALNSHNAFR
ncbi:hypothetical protein [Runella salmonicolor]|uniref:Uncharacterized protein n=1 Tax=Runella salmonicolor TaxID=2950278 RepID=A0ABT1FSZ0_9BACT|nr:hypothetical protein [Runella salmonicolor]MCP1384870.1 hypothetical protein [Runella salmonicolor]